MLHENIAREEAQLQKLARVGSPQAIQMLRQYAQTHQDDAIRLSLANQAVNDAKEMHSKALAMLSGQQPPTVAQQVMQSIGGQGGAPMPPAGGPQGPMPPQGMPPAPPPGMQMPPPAPPTPQGLAGLPAPNLQGMADGGIAGYADGGEIRMAVGGTGEDAIRAQLRSLNMPEQLIETAIQRERMAAENARQQRELTLTPATTSGVGAPQVRSLTSAYEGSANPPMIPNPRMTGGTPAVGPNDPSKAFTKRNIAEAAAKTPELDQFIFNMENSRYTSPYTFNQELATDKRLPKPPRPPADPGAGISMLKPSAGVTALLGAKGISPAEAKEQAGVYMDQPGVERYLTDAKRAFDTSQKTASDAFAGLPQLEKAGETSGAKYIEKTKKELAAEKETLGPMFLINAGLAIASGKSPRFLENLAGGLNKGFEQHKDALKEFKSASKDLDKFEMLEKERRRAEEYGRAKDAMGFKIEQAKALSDYQSKVTDTMVQHLGMKATIAAGIGKDSANEAAADRRAGVTADTHLQVSNNSTRVALQQLKKEPDMIALARILGDGDIKVGYERAHRKSDDEMLVLLNSSVVAQNKGIMDPTQHVPLYTMSDVRKMRAQDRPPVMNLPAGQAAPLLMGGGIPSVFKPGPGVISNDPRFDTRGRVPTTTPAPAASPYVNSPDAFSLR
jgi:hypothetical protein